MEPWEGKSDGEIVGSGPGCGYCVTLEVCWKSLSDGYGLTQRWPWCGHYMALEVAIRGIQCRGT